MRDERETQEKYDLTLDNRQIVSGLIGAVVVLGAVFILGVVVGKKLGGDQRSARAQDLLSALDEKAAAMEQVRKEPALTFQDELTKKTGPEPIRAPVVALPPLPAEPKSQRTMAATQSHPSATAERKLAPSETKGSGSKGAFTLQLSSTQNRTDANRFIEKLRGKGYAPFLTEAGVPGRGTWYRVRLGSFPSKEMAAKYLTDFKRETQLEAFVAAVK
jgi:cell division septation protein DedD